MYNNSLLNNSLYHYGRRPYLNTLPNPFVTPCEALNKYINDPCSIFNKNIIPISTILSNTTFEYSFIILTPTGIDEEITVK